jgi:hypothetical protein
MKSHRDSRNIIRQRTTKKRATNVCHMLGDDCEKDRDCCDEVCCMTSLEEGGSPFSEYEGFCCIRRK